MKTNNTLVGFFGVGPQIEYSYDQLVLVIGKRPDYIFDNSVEKIGKEFRGLKIEDPINLKNLTNKNISVYITVRNHQKIYQQLTEIGVKNIFKVSIERGDYVVKNIYNLNNDNTIRFNSNEFDFKNKWALITGASRGFGLEIAKALANLGVNLIIHASNLENLKVIEDLCKKRNVSVIPIYGDLRDTNSILKIKNSISNLENNIDILINNAAISPINHFDIEKININTYIQTNIVNFIAPTILTSLVFPSMVENNFGRIINITTNLSNNIDSLHYISSKASLDKLTSELSKRVSGKDISVTGIDPGFLKTQMSNFEGINEPITAVNSVLLAIILGSKVNGRFLSSQDYAGLTIKESIEKYYQYIY